jgi:SAM-dependent methyltransferase
MGGRRHLHPLPAGGGRETHALAAMGYHAAAFDPSSHLLERLRAAQAGEEEVVQAGPSDVPPFDDPFDAAIIGWGGYTHIPEAERRSQFLQALARQLKPGAPVLLSFYVRRDDGWRPRTAAQLSNCLRMAIGLKPAVEPGDAMTNRFEHRFTADEVSAELAGAGLDLLEFRPKPFPHAIASKPAEERLE